MPPPRPQRPWAGGAAGRARGRGSGTWGLPDAHLPGLSAAPCWPRCSRSPWPGPRSQPRATARRHTTPSPLRAPPRRCCSSEPGARGRGAGWPRPSPGGPRPTRAGLQLPAGSAAPRERAGHAGKKGSGFAHVGRARFGASSRESRGGGSWGGRQELGDTGGLRAISGFSRELRECGSRSPGRHMA